ncbi:MAG: hypothetical protein NC395_10095 [Prevotella sp.]|nr:hypothetical protein [Prevotella sp.]
MNTITVRILVFFLSLFIMITVFSQIGMQLRDDYVTETAVIYSSAEKVAFQGVYVRNETVINNRANGVVSYTCRDGSKVANGSVIAYTYQSENDILVNRQIKKLKEEVELLESAQNPGTTAVVEPAFISGQIDEQYQTIAFLIAENDLESLGEERKKLQTLMDIYQIVINEETDFNGAIDSLNSRIAELEAQRREPSGMITAENAGYFIGYTDGFESKLSPDTIDRLSADDIKNIISESRKEKNSGMIGKIVDGYDWKMVGIVDPETTDFRVGSSVTVKFSSTPDTVTAVIDSITETDDPHESVIVLSCDELTYNLVQRRAERVEIILNDHKGIKVPRNAIRFNKDNEKGVYILLGQRIAFKKIEPVYECSEYLLSVITSDSGYVSVYDDIIIDGEISADLYVEETEVADDEPEEETSRPTVNNEETETPESVTESDETDENIWQDD